MDERVYSSTFLNPLIQSRLEKSHREGIKRFTDQILVIGQK